MKARYIISTLAVAVFFTFGTSNTAEARPYKDFEKKEYYEYKRAYNKHGYTTIHIKKKPVYTNRYGKERGRHIVIHRRPHKKQDDRYVVKFRW